MPLKEYYDCPLCSRKHSKDNMTWHHLFPAYGKQKRQDPAIYVCLTCHTVVHYCHSNKELCEAYNTLDKLLESESVKKMINLYKYKANDCVFKLKKLKRSC